MTAIAIHLIKRAITLFPCLDDWLVRNQSRLTLLRDRQFTLRLIKSLGLIINREKSELIPAQTSVFIGMEFLTVSENIVRIPLDKVQSVLEFLNWFLKQSSVSARVFLSFLGRLNVTALFVILGRLHLRPLQMAFFAQWKPHVLPLTHKILISHQIKHHLKWWPSREFRKRTPSLQMPVSRAGVLIWNRRDFCFVEFGQTTNPNSISMSSKNDGYFHGSGKSAS